MYTTHESVKCFTGVTMVGEFLNRNEELATLEEHHKEPEGKLVLMYGRRRVGKTRLLREFCKGKDNLYYPAATEAEGVQVTKFAEFLKAYKGGLRFGAFYRWTEVLEYALAMIAETGEKTVVVFDEFQDVLRENKAVPSILRNFWDAAGQFSNMTVILCGSIMSEMQRLNDGKEPLYGRFTKILPISPLSFAQSRDFLPGFSIEKQAEMYSVFGGMPAYLSVAARQRNTLEAIKNLILDPNNVLYEEVPLILGQELREPAKYMSIMESIARGLTKPGQIASATRIERHSLPRYLSQLETMGLVKRDVPATEKGPEKTRKSIYVLRDNLVRFWYRFLFPNKYLIEEGEKDAVLDIVKRDIGTYYGIATEQIWREAVRTASRAGRLPLRLRKTGRYWAGNLEIDICGIGEDDNSYLWGECEWRNTRVDNGDLYGLIEKVKRSGINADGENFFMLCSKMGFTKRLMETAGEMGAILWSLEELEEAPLG